MLARDRVPTAVVCEDDASCRQVARAALERSGYRVVANVDTAMDAFQAAIVHRPDVMILDLMLPWVSGEYAISAICAEVPQCTIIVCSAQDSTNAMAKGASYAVPKGAIGELEALLDGLIARLPA